MEQMMGEGWESQPFQTRHSPSPLQLQQQHQNDQYARSQKQSNMERQTAQSQLRVTLKPSPTLANLRASLSGYTVLYRAATRLQCLYRMNKARRKVSKRRLDRDQLLRHAENRGSEKVCGTILNPLLKLS